MATVTRDQAASINSGRAGTFGRAAAWARIRALPLVMWLVVIGLVTGVAAVVLGIGALTGASGFYLGGLVGAVTATLTCGIAWLLLESSGARSYAIGAIGEQWSANEFDRLGASWKRVDHVPFGQEFDVDHVLVGPTGVFAIETKFTAVEWRIDDGQPNSGLRWAIANAAWKARKIRNLLRNHGAPAVQSTLIMWGPGAPDLADGCGLVDGVLVCSGMRANEWRSRLTSGTPVLSDGEIKALIGAVTRHIALTERAA